MTRPNSIDLGAPKTPSRSVAKLPTTPDRPLSPRSSPSPITKSPRNPLNSAWVSEQQRRNFIQHLEEWSLNHDSSPYFQGEISLPSRNPKGQQHLRLGESVSCFLSDTTFSDARTKIIIRLFPPQGNMSDASRNAERRSRHDSMDAEDTGRNEAKQQQILDSVDPTSEDQQFKHTRSSMTNGCYKLVVRCGAGWMSAREYFSKLYFARLQMRKRNVKPGLQSLDCSLQNRSLLLGPPLALKDTITIRPLFHPFRRLPSELQEMILTTAAGLTGSYNLCDDGSVFSRRRSRALKPISLSTMFQISKDINKNMIPYVYHSTDFHFGLTGFTNFLWQAGPGNRPEIRRLTFHFGKLALLHCVRWLATDSVFGLLEPPVVTNPRSLQYFWRCQIQDLARELNLLTLTINVKGIPTADLAMVVRILRSAFGSVERVLLVEADKDGKTTKLGTDIECLEKTCDTATWRALCAGYWARHKAHQYFFKFELMQLNMEDFEALMDIYKEDLDQ